MTDQDRPHDASHDNAPQPRNAPPPHYAYPYPPPPAEKKPGFLGNITKLGGLVTVCLLLFLVGFYAALFVTASDGGPRAVPYRDGKGPERIAIIPVEGMIDSTTTTFVRRAVNDVLDDPTVKAVVLRVESPGGGATASDEILHELGRLRTERGLPIVASYGDYAASGGYFVSCQADRIYAQPTTVTGSIGVIAPFFTVHGLLEKLGVEPQIMTSTAATSKDTASMFRPWNEADREEVRKLLDAVQARFVEVVVKGRQNVLNAEEVMKLANGGVFTAAESLDNKLIDEIGYIDAALDHARELAGIAEAEPPVVKYQLPGGFFDVLGMSAAAPKRSLLNLDAATIRHTAAELSVPQLMMMPR